MTYGEKTNGPKTVTCCDFVSAYWEIRSRDRAISALGALIPSSLFQIKINNLKTRKIGTIKQTTHTQDRRSVSAHTLFLI